MELYYYLIQVIGQIWYNYWPIFIFVITLIFILLPLSLYILLLSTKNNNKFRFAYDVHHKRDSNNEKIVRVSDIITFFIPYLFTIIFFLICINKSIFSHNFINIIKPYLLLLPWSFITPTTFIALLGPTILTLNYRLFKSHIYDNSGTKNFRFSYIFTNRRFIDSQFDHTSQLSALMIAWGAFAYQIITDPIYSIQKLLLLYKMYLLGLAPNLNQPLKQFQEFDYGYSLDYCIKIIGNDIFSLFIISLSLGFVLWSFIRLISGQLSTIDVIRLYEKDDHKAWSSAPTLASRITVYRYILVMLSFLCLVWSKCYLTFSVRNDLFSQNLDLKFKSDVLSLINNSLNIPENVSDGLFFVFLVLSYLVTILIFLHFSEYYRHILKACKDIN